jgi:uncharacterized protein YjbJ (UPF0337 family)
LDNSGGAAGSMAFGHGQFVHARRFHSHFAGPGGGCGSDPPDTGSKPGALVNKDFLTIARHASKNYKGGFIEMNKDQVEGKVKDVAGRVERQVGEWTDDPKKQVHGAAKQAEGKVQHAVGDVKEAAKKAADEHAKNEREEARLEEERELNRRKAG